MVWQNLNGNNAIEAGVASAVDLAHATGAERRLNFVGAKFRARGQGHLGAKLHVTSGEAAIASSGALCRKLQLYWRISRNIHQVEHRFLTNARAAATLESKRFP